MLKRRLVSFTAAAIMVVSAAMLTALAPGGASAATTAAGTSGHLGLVNGTDCEYIEAYETGSFIAGNGVNEPVSLKSTGNCFTLMFPFTDPYGKTAYEYQNGDGHCLWDNGGTVEVGAACQNDHPREQFYGFDYQSGSTGLEGGPGWMVSDMWEQNTWMYVQGCSTGYEVMGTYPDCDLWNFPSS
jgi:hypothetical protein